jgi:hypothetical protein
MLHTSIPILQVTSSERAGAFYCGRLGFTLELRCTPNTPPKA